MTSFINKFFHIFHSKKRRDALKYITSHIENSAVLNFALKLYLLTKFRQVNFGDFFGFGQQKSAPKPLFKGF